MSEEKQKSVLPAPDLDSYIHKGSLSRTIAMSLVALSVLAVAIWFIVFTGEPILSDEDFRAQFAFHGIDSQWVVKNTIERPDFKGILLVPQIKFQVRNESQKDLKAVQMIGIFRFLNTGRSIGESIIYLFDKKAKPGQSSPEMVMLTENGYESGSVQDFENSRKNWEGAMVEIYAKSGRQKLTFIKSFYISRRIKGLDLDVQLAPRGGR
jgi:hypothetical protein